MGDPRTILSITKYVSTTLTAAFGILGLLVEYKNKRTKKTTFWGRVAITGIVVSALVSLLSQYEEGVLQSRDAVESAKKSTELLKKVDRLENPLRDVFITYAVDLPVEIPALQTYTQQLRVGLTQFLVNPPIGLDQSPNALGSVSAWDGPGQPHSVAIYPGSPLLPRDPNEMLFTVLRIFAFSVTFSDHPKEADKADPTRTPLLSWGGVIVPNGPPDFLPTIDFTLKTGALNMGVYRIPILRGAEKTRGPLGLTDLLGTDLTVGLSEVGLQPTTPWKNDYAAIIHGAKLARFEMTVGSQGFSLPSSAFKKVSSEHGSVYSYLMPANEAGLDSLRLH